MLDQQTPQKNPFLIPTPSLGFIDLLCSEQNQLGLHKGHPEHETTDMCNTPGTG